MRLAVSKMSALHVIRDLRDRGLLASARPCDLLAPSPEPSRRWSARLVPWERLGLSEPPSRERPIDIAVPSARARIQAGFARCTIYDRSLPEGAYLDAGGGLLAPCPELLFLEMASVMSAPVHVLLGFELCGRFSRDARDPRTGSVRMGVRPATSVERIGTFLGGCRWSRGLDRARTRLKFVADNAWSPMEAVVAAMASLPDYELGYDLGPVVLNHRVDNPKQLVALGCRSSRVPDVLISGTSVGLNYDGRGHFDELEPSAAREKYVDDLRRNRELAATGLTILPVTAEDLFAENGLDIVMLEVAAAVAREDPERAAHTQAVISARALRGRRQELIWSLLPWDAAISYSLILSERERRAISQSYVEEAVI